MIKTINGEELKRQVSPLRWHLIRSRSSDRARSMPGTPFLTAPSVALPQVAYQAQRTLGGS